MPKIFKNTIESFEKIGSWSLIYKFGTSANKIVDYVKESCEAATNKDFVAAGAKIGEVLALLTK